MKLDPISSETSVLKPASKKIMWFPVRNRKEVNAIISRLKSEHVQSLRVGIDCAEFNTKKGQKWYDWLLPTLADNFDLELCFDNYLLTPGRPLAQKHGLPEIVEHFIHKHGKYFTTVELWRNHSANVEKEPRENIFAEDVVFAATWAKHLGKKVVLGKIQVVDFEWINQLVSSRFLKTTA